MAQTRVIKGEVPAGALEADGKDVALEWAQGSGVDFSGLVFAPSQPSGPSSNGATSRR